MAIFLVCGGTVLPGVTVTLAPDVANPVMGFLLENILRNDPPFLMPASSVAGNEMMEVVEPDLLTGSILL